MAETFGLSKDFVHNYLGSVGPAAAVDRVNSDDCREMGMSYGESPSMIRMLCQEKVMATLKFSVICWTAQRKY